MVVGPRAQRSNGIQTNGVLINDEHIRMFRQYKVEVGSQSTARASSTTHVGPAPSPARGEATAKTEATIERLRREGVPRARPSPYIVITRRRTRLPTIHDWFRRLDRRWGSPPRGSTSSKSTATEWARQVRGLSRTDENVQALVRSFIGSGSRS